MQRTLSTREVTSWDTQPPDQPAQDVQAPQLTANDLAVLGRAIDIGFQQGAYSAAQAAPIGASFVKLQAYLVAAMRKQSLRKDGDA